MNVEYINHMGDDLMVVNAARVSFDKQSEWEHEILEPDRDEPPQPPARVLRERDAKLISFLARNGHWTPFGHPTICLRVTVPIFVANQLKRHQVGLVVNEVSRRYVTTPPEFYRPEIWRGKPIGNVKQGSEGVFDGVLTVHGQAWLPGDAHALLCRECLRVYDAMLMAGVAPEQARMVLPQSMYTSWYWTGSLAAFARVCKLRLDPHAQGETQDVARMISDLVEPLFPISWRALLAPQQEASNDGTT